MCAKHVLLLKGSFPTLSTKVDNDITHVTNFPAPSAFLHMQEVIRNWMMERPGKETRGRGGCFGWEDILMLTINSPYTTRNVRVLYIPCMLSSP